MSRREAEVAECLSMRTLSTIVVQESEYKHMPVTGTYSDTEDRWEDTEHCHTRPDRLNRLLLLVLVFKGFDPLAPLADLLTPLLDYAPHVLLRDNRCTFPRTRSLLSDRLFLG
jgi:hypothetical protein